ncbi:MAG TPA: restriction endonuclease [Actinomycetota bacterium]|nr:restriction endonuclease [Actinomycetota bacterium]
MRYLSPLAGEFNRVKDISRHSERGAEFERFVGRLFQAARFQVEMNPAAARPRQTDLAARYGNDVYLVEVKAGGRKSTIDAVDAVRTRLEEVEGSVTGILVSLAGFSRNAISRVEEKRARPVLLLSGDEIDHLCDRPEDLRGLLVAKQRRLSIQGKVLLDEPDGGRGIVLPAIPHALRSDAEFLLGDGSRKASVDCDGGFGGFVFAEELLDVDWVPGGGSGVSIDLPLSVRDADELARLVDALAASGWGGKSAWWSINQRSINWHGIGAQSFVDALRGAEERYTAPGPFHGTEDVCLYDVFDGGHYTLTANVRASAPRRVFRGGMSMQMIGVPLDTGPLEQLRDMFAVGRPVYFRALTERAVTTVHLWPDQVEVHPSGLIVRTYDFETEEEKEWVAGIVVPNPFFRSGRGVPLPDDQLIALRQSELLLCPLRSHHYDDDRERRYFLWAIHWTWTSDALVVSVVADWDDPRDGADPTEEIAPAAPAR